MRKIIGALAVWLALCGAALAQTCPGLPFTFTANTTIRSAQVNSNFTSLLTCQNTLLAPLASPVFSGSVVIPTLSVTGAETVGSTLGVTGAATLGSTVGITGLTTHSAAVNEAFAVIASAATTNIGAAAANYLQVTGTTGITAFDTIQAGTERTLEFAAALTLTNSGNVILLGGSNYTTAAGDVLKFRSEGSGVWRQVTLGQARGFPVLSKQVFTTPGSNTFTTPANTNANTVYKFTLVGGGGAGASLSGAGAAAGGGGGGATAIFWGSGLASGGTAAITVGAGGVGGNGAASTAVVGATTITAGGGQAGSSAGSSNPGGNGGTATNGAINIPGAPGGTGNAANGFSGTGGGSTMGGGANTANTSNGTAGSNFGGGGSGASNGAFTGGNGAQGIVIVEWVQ